MNHDSRRIMEVPKATAIAMGDIVILEQPDDMGYRGHGAGRMVPVRRTIVLEFRTDEELREAVRVGRVEFVAFGKWKEDQCHG